MKIIFGRRPAVGSWLIRFFTWSDWSHCGIVLSDGGVLHATWPEGVHITGLEEWKRKYPHNETVSVDLRCDLSAEAWARKQLGKPYDLSGLFAFGFHRDWQQDDKWFCSECVGSSLANGGLDFSVPSSRLTPGGLYMIASTHR